MAELFWPVKAGCYFLEPCSWFLGACPQLLLWGGIESAGGRQGRGPAPGTKMKTD